MEKQVIFKKIAHFKHFTFFPGDSKWIKMEWNCQRCNSLGFVTLYTVFFIHHLSWTREYKRIQHPLSPVMELFFSLLSDNLTALPHTFIRPLHLCAGSSSIKMKTYLNNWKTEFPSCVTFNPEHLVLNIHSGLNVGGDGWLGTPKDLNITHES